MSIAKQNLTEHLTSDELALINKKLDAVIQSKVDSGELSFSSPKDGGDPNPSTIDLSQFGLHNPEDIKIFLLSPAGETVTHEIGAELALERAIEEERQLQIQEEITMEERRRGFLFHWLLAEEAEAQKAQNELIEMQQEKILKPNEQTPQKKAPEENKALKDTLEGYDSSIKKFQEQQANLKAEEEALTQELGKLEDESIAIDEKHKTYNNVLNAYDKSAPTFENNPEMLDREISSLERQIDRMSQHVFDELDKGNEKEARKILNQQNALNLQLASLKDIRSKVGNEKVFFDADLNSEGVTYDKALFAVPKEQAQSLVKHDGKYYLLAAGQKWDDVKNDPAKLEEAQARFEKVKPEIMSVKNVVQHVKKQEVELNATRKEETHSKIAVNKAEQLMVNNQITSMQAARANAQHAVLNTPALTMHPPQSTITTGNSFGLGSVSIPTPTLSKGTSPSMPSPQQILTAAFVQTVNNGQKPTWGSLFTAVKTIEDPKLRDQMDDYVTDKAKKTLNRKEQAELDKNPETFKEKIKRMLEMAPVPPTTMNDLLKNMPKFGEDSYKNNVTSELSPVEKREEHVSTPTAPR
ncbi:coiled coil protein [Legionella resiliens]|uniref:Coiled coil protein n=1 Tax=Legionella resiliens TaxID=2905958 RepID=A0ABS8X3P7_9GAMM|nr:MULTISPECIES: coiled coil protein [unclassified Legionella]MCE0724228.1 coiled coil protein [Legionella sp. 9fVS26]MCE3533380.1 coiled coil protein [Legionella sp. 8cVS16]